MVRISKESAMPSNAPAKLICAFLESYQVLVNFLPLTLGSITPEDASHPFVWCGNSE